ncbi:hypothetical protein I9054_011250 [Acinetobacter bereziniae]|uniref:Uncharacterized protein n=1 Tax=Acinetobacter bereziniae TaxID=106648 RepID=A0A8I1ANE5_ACIBZ|nr:hypothetical protein [Acinetobacter bereziniae]QQC82819.1 hypothetical protein I9190_10835 [Acinetobacter bereziniae]UUN95963.1 hypothetical protein I9054_011250 [Acinetobacter bereziniae]
MEYLLYLFGFIMGMIALVMSILSIVETRKKAGNEFLKRHEQTLRRHNNYPKE